MYAEKMFKTHAIKMVIREKNIKIYSQCCFKCILENIPFIPINTETLNTQGLKEVGIKLLSLSM